MSDFACAVAGYSTTGAPDPVEWSMLVYSRLIFCRFWRAARSPSGKERGE